MLTRFRRGIVPWMCLGAIHALADPSDRDVSAAAAHWRGVNPDRLSGGLFAALDADGAFGPRALPQPPRARATYGDLSKGKPPAVLDARVGVNLRLGDDPDVLPSTQRGQAEPHIVRSSANPEVLLATFQEGRYVDAGAITCGYSVSRDGGLAWTRGVIPNLTTASGGRFNRATDPVAGAGPQGDLYLQNLVSAAGAFQLAAVVVSRSADTGATWAPPSVVYESTNPLVFPDKNWLAVNDHAATPNSGRLVSTWTQFTRNAAGATIGSPIVASVSDDRGATWSAPINVTPDGANNQGSQPVFLPDGSLVVVYITFLDPTNVTRFNILCKRSTDGGQTYPGTAHTVVDSVQGWDDPDVRDGVFLPSVTVDRGTGGILVTYVAVVSGSPRVMLTESSDQGVSWSAPIAVSDQPAGVSVMTPVVAAEFGTVSVVFMDKRNAPDGRSFVDLYAALRQRDRWLPGNVRLSSMSSDIRYAAPTSRGYMFGDYLGIAPAVYSDFQPCVAVWCDTRTGDADPFVVRFPPPFPQHGGSSQVQPYTDWRMAHFRSHATAESAMAEMTADPDGDGASNLAEFALGTNPRVAEYGDTLVLTRRSADVLDVAWAVPHGRIEEFGMEAAVLQEDAAAAPMVLSSALGVAPATPTVTPALGLAWKTAEIRQLAGRAVGVTRRFSYGIMAGGTPWTTRASNPDVPTSGVNARLINLSTRARVGTGAAQLIMGFVLDGNKSILLRVAGPALGALGVAGTLADPQLTIEALASDLQRTNDNWQQPGSAATSALFARLGAFPFQSGSRDAALALDLGIQSYSAIVSGTANTTGLALAEVYDADATPGAPARSRLLNVSTRGTVGTGDDALIAGFVVSGTQPRRVLIRAIGPSLASFGVEGALIDPRLTLFRGATPLASNDDWELSRSGAAVAATAQRLGAFPLNAASLDAALLITLEPGAYTVVVGGVDGATGIALVEVYDAD